MNWCTTTWFPFFNGRRILGAIYSPPYYWAFEKRSSCLCSKMAHGLVTITKRAVAFCRWLSNTHQCSPVNTSVSPRPPFPMRFSILGWLSLCNYLGFQRIWVMLHCRVGNLFEYCIAKGHSFNAFIRPQL